MSDADKKEKSAKLYEMRVNAGNLATRLGHAMDAFTSRSGWRLRSHCFNCEAVVEVSDTKMAGSPVLKSCYEILKANAIGKARKLGHEIDEDKFVSLGYGGSRYVIASCDLCEKDFQVSVSPPRLSGPMVTDHCPVTMPARPA